MTHSTKTPIVVTIFGFISVIVIILAVALLWRPEGQSLILAGKWTLTLPRGIAREVTMKTLDDGRFDLSAVIFSGIYRLTDKRLEMDEPLDKRLTEFVWEIRDDGTLTLIEGPAAAKTGSTYIGATLQRPNPESPENPQR